MLYFQKWTIINFSITHSFSSWINWIERSRMTTEKSSLTFSNCLSSSEFYRQCSTPSFPSFHELRKIVQIEKGDQYDHDSHKRADIISKYTLIPAPSLTVCTSFWLPYPFSLSLRESPLSAQAMIIPGMLLDGYHFRPFGAHLLSSNFDYGTLLEGIW